MQIDILTDYGVPPQLPAAMEMTPQVVASLSAVHPRARFAALQDAAFADFCRRWGVIGKFDSLSGAPQAKAWERHGPAYMMAAVEAYSRATNALG